MSKNLTDLSFSQISKKEIALSFLFLLTQLFFVGYFLNNEEESRINSFKLDSENIIGGLDLYSVDNQIEISFTSCGPDRDCETADDNSKDILKNGDRAIVEVELSNLGLADTTNNEVVLDIPNGVCYLVGSIENSLNGEGDVRYSSSFKPDYEWSYLPRSNFDNADCNVKALKISLNSALKSSIQYQYEVGSFSGIKSGLVEVSDRLEVYYPGPFTLSGEISTGDAAKGDTSEISSGDLDNDGDLDMILTKEGESSKVFLNNGVGNFSYKGVIPETFSYGYTDLLYDFDNDGDLDRVHGVHSYNDYMTLNDGDGDFTLGPDHGYGAGVMPPPTWSTLHINKGDFNRDGNIDLVWGMNSNSQRNVLMLGDGNSKFTPGPDNGYGEGLLPGLDAMSWALLPGDVDGDQDLDLIVINGNNHSQLLLNDGSARFIEGPDIGLGKGNLPGGNSESRHGALFDYDQDQDLDLLLARGNKSGQPNYLIVNDGAGSFSIGPDLGYGSGILPGGNHQTRGFDIADFDKDGYEDVVVYNNNYEAQLLKGGSGSFSLWEEIGYGVGNLPGGSQNRKIGEVFDFNGDGTVDIVLPGNDGVPIKMISNNIHQYDSKYSFILSPTTKIESWGELDVVYSLDRNSRLSYSIMDSNCTNSVPGFEMLNPEASIDLSSISTDQYPSLCIVADFFSPNGTDSPALDEWIVTYRSDNSRKIYTEFISNDSAKDKLTFEAKIESALNESNLANNFASSSIPSTVVDQVVPTTVSEDRDQDTEKNLSDFIKDKVVNREVISVLDNLSIFTVSTAVGITVITVVAIMLSKILEIRSILIRTCFGLLRALRLRASGSEMGQVYDINTKEPISNAIVKIYDLHDRLIRVAVTSSDGIFYGIELPSDYKLVASKSGYQFPVNRSISNSDLIYKIVYRGGTLTIVDGKMPFVGIPLDPIGTNSRDNTILLIRESFFLLSKVLIYLLFIVGFNLSLLILLIDTTYLNLLIMLLYIPVFIIAIFLVNRMRNAKYGTVIDQSGEVVRGLRIGLKGDRFERILLERISNEHGRYRFVVPRGRYRLVLLDPGYRLVGGDFIVFAANKEDFEISKDIVVEKIIDPDKINKKKK